MKMTCTAGHAASVGRVDAQTNSIYLMSRGLSEAVRAAERLVIRGFLGRCYYVQFRIKARARATDRTRSKGS